MLFCPYLNFHFVDLGAQSQVKYKYNLALLILSRCEKIMHLCRKTLECNPNYTKIAKYLLQANIKKDIICMHYCNWQLFVFTNATCLSTIEGVYTPFLHIIFKLPLFVCTLSYYIFLCTTAITLLTHFTVKNICMVLLPMTTILLH